MEPSPADLPLHEDLTLLSDVFAHVLRDLTRSEVYGRVQAIAHAGANRHEVADLLQQCPQEALTDVLRAFAEMFTHINLAERVHRLRRRHASFAPGATPQDGSLLNIARISRQHGVPAQDAVRAALSIKLQPVFTAHPTEATRGSLLRKEQRMAALLLADRSREPQAIRDGLRAEMVAAWQTESLTDAPTVADEVEHVTFYLTQVIYPVVPTFFEGMRDALADGYGSDAAEDYRRNSEDKGPEVRFGTWVGGDMDGNPNVGPDTLRGTLTVQRLALMGAYHKDLQDLYDRLSHSSSRVTISAPLAEALQAYAAQAPQVKLAPRHSAMPDRTMLRHMMARLQPGPLAYTEAHGLFSDLQLMARSLDGHGGRFGGSFAVRRVMRRVATFGLHLAALDVRQDSLVHRAAVAQLLGAPGLADGSLDSAARQRRMTDALAEIQSGRSPVGASALGDPSGHTYQGEPGTALHRMLAVFAALKAARKDFGEAAIGLYIISMAQDVDDLLAVLLLAHAAQLTVTGASQKLHVPLQVAPLFETVPDLNRAPAVLAALCAHPLWREHMAAQGHTQAMMLGYSDSNKESGFLASREALLTAEAGLLRVAHQHGVTLQLFHGRGGTASRGGSKPRQAILASQDGAPLMRLTEQGEIIHAKYGLEPLALRTLELMGGALWQREMMASGAHPRPPQVAPAEYTTLLALCAHNSLQAYQHLTAGNPGFFDYFNAATPIDVITRLRIGSRPPSRRECRGLGDLRAIPWVFAWMQNRHMLPGWYGLGQGLQAGLDAAGMGALRNLHARWPFFRNIMDDAAVSLAKSDMNMGARYAALASQADPAIWAAIRAEYALSCALVCAITEQQHVLQQQPVLQRSIARRAHLIEPLSLLQLDTLATWRAGNRSDDDLLRRLMLSVKGIAKGLHNTG